MLHSHAFLRSDLKTEWYTYWSKRLNQTESGRGNFALESNKFWQNAAMAQALSERGILADGRRGVGFGVGMERLPALFASLGAKITATDQDFTAQKASHWEDDQLAHGIQSLNLDGICPVAVFQENVSYRSVDMNNIPADLYGQFDFLWSNCALGHLGSIDNSKQFIINSLRCLKAGGWAVHTTEVNILSDRDTLETPDTVFFRQKDLFDLFKTLSLQGYVVSALNFYLGSDALDKLFTLKPVWGTEHSKILVNNYMATQIILVIKKPERSHRVTRSLQVAKHYMSYLMNLLRMRSYISGNTELRELIAMSVAAREINASDIKITPKATTISVRLGRNETIKVKLTYQNLSTAALFSPSGYFAGTRPLALATSGPVNRRSEFKSIDWYGEDNRLTYELSGASKKSNAFEPIEYVKPGQLFSVEFSISANNQKVNHYIESFCLVKEGDNVIPETEVTLAIELI